MIALENKVMLTNVEAVAGVESRLNAAENRFTWCVEDDAGRNYERLGERLAEVGELYRNSGGDGLSLITPERQRLITKGADLAPVIIDRVRLQVLKGEKVTGSMPPARDLDAMLKSEKFLGKFPPLDAITTTPLFLSDLTLTSPGYNDGGPGERVFYIGPTPNFANSVDTISRFLDAMPFDTNADRTGALAAALTMQLRRKWPGRKPVVCVTATRSHSGKTTLTDFICGPAVRADILYQARDWPMQSELQKKLAAHPETGIIVLDNVRQDSSGSQLIRSAFVESFVTNPMVSLAAPGAGPAIELPNRFVVAINSNDGAMSPDLMNRSLPIHLAPRGDLYRRDSGIGDPREFLSEYCERIAAELRWMITTWVAAGCPLDETVKHPMPSWAKEVGGILKFHGFDDFLANYDLRKSLDDPVKAALGILGAAMPEKPLPATEWGTLALIQGVGTTLFSGEVRSNQEARARAIGVLMTKHQGLEFEAESETTRYRLRLHRRIKRWDSQHPHRRYWFKILDQQDIPLDE